MPWIENPWPPFVWEITLDRTLTIGLDSAIPLLPNDITRTFSRYRYGVQGFWESPKLIPLPDPEPGPCTVRSRIVTRDASVAEIPFSLADDWVMTVAPLPAPTSDAPLTAMMAELIV